MHFNRHSTSDKTYIDDQIVINTKYKSKNKDKKCELINCNFKFT